MSLHPFACLVAVIALAVGAVSCAASADQKTGDAGASPSGGLAAEFGCSGVEAQPVLLPGASSFIYKTASGRDLRTYVFQPATPSANRPAILFYFGGGWRRGTVTQFLGQAQAAANRGYVAVLADYRVACRDKTSVLAAVEDARSAYSWLRREAPSLGVDPERIVLAGGSAGGQLALVTTASAPDGARPAALVLFNPAVDLTAIAPILGLSRDEAARISPSAMVMDDVPPMIMFHGTADRLVPIATARAFCGRMTDIGRQCALHEYAGQGHGFFNDREKDAASGVAPYEDTLARMFAFLGEVGSQPDR